MRELKFRVWDKRKEIMLYDVRHSVEWFDYIDYPHVYILMQYTGFKDCNDFPVYEGDIVSYEAGEPNRDDGEFFKNKAEVKFENGAFWPRPIKEECEDSFYDFELKNIKVIGNVFENHELLEKKT